MRFLLYLLLLLALPLSNAAIDLFNEVDLNGWTTFLVDTRTNDPRHVFSVTNAMLRISGDGLGYLATRAQYTNYHLIVDYRWGSQNTKWGDRVGKARDSGVFLHAVGPDGNSHDDNGAFMAAIECNIFQGATGDFLLIRGTDPEGKLIAPKLTASVASERDKDGWFTWKLGGHEQRLERWGRINWRNKDPNWRDELDFRGKNDIEKPDDWNRLECICHDGSIQVRLNEVLVNEAHSVWPNSGKILLQCEGSEIFFRRVALMF